MPRACSQYQVDCLSCDKRITLDWWIILGAVPYVDGYKTALLCNGTHDKPTGIRRNINGSEMVVY